jgi:ribosomal protein S18 acetylase RimI-like enzyme
MENAPQPVPASGDNQTTTGRTVVRLRRDFGTPFESPRWPDGFTVRTLLPSDAASLHALLTLVFDDTEQSFDLWWPKLSGDPEFDAELCFLVFDAAGQLAGAAQCWTGAYLKDLAVRPEARRLGIGEALLRHVLHTFRDRGAAHVDLKTDSDNFDALRLYERVGMRQVPIDG